MLRAKRLAYTRLATTDIARDTDYWSRIVGLAIVDRTADRVVLATRLGQECVVLEKGARDGVLNGLAFQLDPGVGLGDVERALWSHGIAVSRRADPTPCAREALAFEDPRGATIEVFTDTSFAADDGLDCGVQPQKFGHMAFTTRDPQKITQFYCDVLGFRVSDWIGSRFSFLRCGPNHHTINFAHGPTEGIHHIAFEMRDRADLLEACDTLARREVQLVWGPSRHVVGHNMAAYHQNPSDLRIELFTELDQMSDESLGYFDPRPWHEERPLRPKTWPEDTWRSQWGFGSFGSFPGYPERPVTDRAGNRL